MGKAEHNGVSSDYISVLWNSVVDEVRQEYLSPSQQYPWIVGFSGGKDSTLVAHAVFEAILSIPPYARTREVHIVSNDTMVESPFVILHLDEVTQRIARAAKSLEIPISVARTYPDLDKTFWTLLIGKGYPSPNQTMRWCTDRLKILPTSSYIKRNVSEFGAAVVVLGVRRAESTSRQKTVHSYKNMTDSRLHEHSELPGAFIYRPIVELSTDDVWEILATFHAPWGGSHSALFKLYRDAQGGECPVMLSNDEAAGCGTSNSRFGCWTCTVVEKDRSLQGYVDSGNHEYMPLINFRDWLKSIRNDPERRQALRRNGRLTFDLTGKHIPGPFTIKARREILEKLLLARTEFGKPLISGAEIDLIYKIWSNEI